MIVRHTITILLPLVRLAIIDRVDVICGCFEGLAPSEGQGGVTIYVIRALVDLTNLHLILAIPGESVLLVVGGTSSLPFDCFQIWYVVPFVSFTDV